jgi:DNA-directed RNA polymerase subunit RPC12/RpoP
MFEVEAVVKCPYCGFDGESRLLKTWKYAGWDVYFYQCSNCGKKFRWQVDPTGVKKSYAIRVGVGGKKNV